MSEVQKVRVWDPVVRVFHWTLVAAFFTAYFTEGDLWRSLHVYAGYAVFGLVLARVLWGFIGSPHARFRDFVVGPRAILAYLKDMLHGRARRFIGHNPAGGAMIILMLASLVMSTVSGMVLYGADAGLGPLALLFPPGSRESASEAVLEEVHEVFANFTVFLVALHVAGVLVESWLHRENLVAAMFTGRKRVNDSGSGENVT